MIGVNAQSYTVLVMDVPDINKERKRQASPALFDLLLLGCLPRASLLLPRDLSPVS